MKVEDLMIGDWVEVTNSDHLKYVQVNGILGNSIFTKEDEYESEEIDINDLQPIYVTKELLKEIGFQHDSNEDLWIDDTANTKNVSNPVFLVSKDQRITINNVDMNSFKEWYIHIDTEDMRTLVGGEFTFLHELQHLYKIGDVKENIIIK